MSDALMYQGNAPARLKYWLRWHLHGSATLMMEAGITSTLRFMREEAEGFESLLMGEHEVAGQSGETRPDFGWYAAWWRGSPVEVVLSPQRGGRPGRAEIVCAAGNAGVLASFLESLHEFSTRLEGRCLRYGDGRWEIARIRWDVVVLPPVTLAGIRGSRWRASSITATRTHPGGSPGGAASCS